MACESQSPLAPGTGIERFFFALVPPRELAFATAGWASDILGPGWQVQQAGRLHITLAITLAITLDFRTPPPGLVDRLLRAGERVIAAPVAVDLGLLSLSNRSACLRPCHANREMKALHQAIARAMAETGVMMRAGWRFNPHLTLGYRDGRPSQQPVEPRCWQAEEFVLIRSLVGRTRHLPLGRWPLRAVVPVQYALF